MSNLLHIASASTQAILQVTFTALFGFLLVRYDIISQPSHKGLVAFNVNFFTPCFLFIKMSANATLSTYLAMWPIVIIYISTVVLSNVIAYLGAKALGFSLSKQKFATLAIFFSNTNSLPVSIFQSVVLNPSVYLFLRWGKDDTPEKIEARGLIYIMMYLALTNIVCWSYGVRLITPQSALPIVDESTPILPRIRSSSSLLAFLDKLFHFVKNILNPPLTAIIAAFLVALIPPVKAFMFGSSPLSRAFTASLKLCGSAAVPSLLISLGGSLAFLLQRRNFLTFRLVGLIAFSRLLLIPLILIPAILYLRSYFYLGGDPAFLFAIMLIISTPTAVNTLSLCQSVKAFEDEMAMVLLFSYLAALPVLTITVSCYIYIIQITGALNF